ncbi:MAG: hypothetical protein ABI333_17155 [bacterium]
MSDTIEPELNTHAERTGCLLELDAIRRVKVLSRGAYDHLKSAPGDFALLQGYEAAVVDEAWTVEGESRATFTLLAILLDDVADYGPEMGGMPDYQEVHDLCAVGLVTLPMDLGHVVMTPERLADKIADLFQHRDIDFEDYPLFSSRYYVTADDATLFRDNVPRAMLEAIEACPGFHLEILGNRLMARRPQVWTDTEAVDLAELCLGIAESLTRPAEPAETT